MESSFLLFKKKKKNTEIDLLENMSTQIEVDDDATVTTISKTSCVEPVLRTSPFVKRGRKWCTIRFSGAMKKNDKRANLQKLTDQFIPAESFIMD